jgi:glutamine synthetase
VPRRPPRPVRAGVRFARVTYCDNAGLIRAKAAPAARLAVVLRHGVGFSSAEQAVPMLADVPVPEAGLGPVGEVALVPDPTTLTPLPFSPGQAIVLGEFRTLDGRPWPHCPRAFLRRQLAAVEAAGLTLRAAFESEFYLLRPAGDAWVPVDDTNFAVGHAFDLAHAFLDELVATLEQMGLGVHLLHPEAGPGQFEVSVAHAEGVAVADRQVLFREAVRGVAARHGCRASFAPKPLADRAGSGCHLHLSLWRGRTNAIYGPRPPLHLSPLAEHAIGGLLRHLPGLAAITLPSVNSYARIRPHWWAGAFACYGLENREAAVRVIAPREGPASANLELKAVDASSNPYLALGAALAALNDGLARGLSPGEPVDVDPGSLPEAVRQARGIAALPRSLAEAIAALERDAVLRDALGPELARSFLAVRRREWDLLGGLAPEEVARAHLFRY